MYARPRPGRRALSDKVRGAGRHTCPEPRGPFRIRVDTTGIFESGPPRCARFGVGEGGRRSPGARGQPFRPPLRHASSEECVAVDSRRRGSGGAEEAFTSPAGTARDAWSRHQKMHFFLEPWLCNRFLLIGSPSVRLLPRIRTGRPCPFGRPSPVYERGPNVGHLLTSRGVDVLILRARVLNLDRTINPD